MAPQIVPQVLDGVQLGRMMKRVGFTDEGLARMKAAVLIAQPWRHSTGSRTAEGKSRSSQNGRSRQVGERSKRALQREIAATLELGGMLASARMAAAKVCAERSNNDL